MEHIYDWHIETCSFCYIKCYVKYCCIHEFPFFLAFNVPFHIACVVTVLLLSSVLDIQRQVLPIYNNNNNNIKCLTSFLTTNSNTTRISPSSYFMLQTLLRVLPLCVCVQKWDKMVIWLLLRKSLVEQKCNRFFRLCNSNDFKSKYDFSVMRVYRSMEVPFFWVITFELCRLFTIIASSVKLNGNGRQ